MKEYSYNIINDVYNWMISRKKDIEVRILKEKSQAIQVGDIITFNNQDNIGKFVKTKIKYYEKGRLFFVLGRKV